MNEEINVHEMHVYLYDLWINLKRCAYIASTMCRSSCISALLRMNIVKTVLQYVHWSIWKTIQMKYHGKAATFRCMYIASIMCRLSSISVLWLVGWLFWGLTSIKRSFSHISTWKQEITNLWKFKWRGRESNPGPLAPQAKSSTTRPPLLPHFSLIRYEYC